MTKLKHDKKNVKKVLVISPHPDDEALGCGGTLCIHKENKDEIFIIYMTSGEKGNTDKLPEEKTAIIREKEARKVSKVYDAKKIEFWHLPDGAVEASDEIVKKMHKKILSINPDVIYVTSENEKHPDHRAAAAIIKKAVEKLSKKPQVLMFEIWTPIQKIGLVSDISDYIKEKMRAIKLYKSQCAIINYEKGIEALDRYHGEMHNWPDGGNYAEIFQELK